MKLRSRESQVCYRVLRRPFGIRMFEVHMSAARLPVPYAVVSQGKLVLSASGFRSVAMINVGWKKRAEMCILNINRAKVEVLSESRIRID